MYLTIGTFIMKLINRTGYFCLVVFMITGDINNRLFE